MWVSMKKLGIIGGMGPLATVKFYQHIINYTNAHCDQDNIETHIHSNTLIPDRTSYIEGSGENPKDQLLRSAKLLEKQGCDVIVTPCNTAHFFLKDITYRINANFISMIEVVCEHVAEKYCNHKIALLATKGVYKSRLYHNQLTEEPNVDLIVPSADEQQFIMSIIYKGVKANDLDYALAIYDKLVDALERKGIEAIILGCTELSIVNSLYSKESRIVFIDPLKLLAKKTVEYCTEDVGGVSGVI